MNDLPETFNYAEAGLWFAIGLLLIVAAVRVAARRRIVGGLAVAFLAFGVSDLIEANTGAWWRPPWLLVLKGACVVAFLVGFRAYYVSKKPEPTVSRKLDL